jgi:dCTP deaminase
LAIKADRWIKKMALEHRMIEPFEDRQVRVGVVSYGLSSNGYDIRVADEFKVFTNINTTVIDPKQFDPRSFVDVKTDVCIVPPNSRSCTVEYFQIAGHPHGLSGQADLRPMRDHRQRDALEPEWEGTAAWISIRAAARSTQLGSPRCCSSERRLRDLVQDKQGKYLKRPEVTLPRICFAPCHSRRWRPRNAHTLRSRRHSVTSPGLREDTAVDERRKIMTAMSGR